MKTVSVFIELNSNDFLELCKIEKTLTVSCKKSDMCHFTELQKIVLKNILVSIIDSTLIKCDELQNVSQEFITGYDYLVTHNTDKGED